MDPLHVMVQVGCNVRSFLGCAAGQIEIEPQNPQWIGAQSKDNIAAEVSALVVAQVTALISNFPTIIRPDLQFSRHLVQGTQTTDKIGPIVEVSQLLAAWGAKHVQEVRAHKDDPFNELADSLAKWAADTGESCGSVPFCTPHEIASRHDRSSLWIHTMPHCFAGTMPVRKDGNFLAFNSNRKVNHDTDHHSDPNDMKFSLLERTKPMIAHTLDVRCGSTNRFPLSASLIGDTLVQILKRLLYTRIHADWLFDAVLTQ